MIVELAKANEPTKAILPSLPPTVASPNVRINP